MSFVEKSHTSTSGFDLCCYRGAELSLVGLQRHTVLAKLSKVWRQTMSCNLAWCFWVYSSSKVSSLFRSSGRCSNFSTSSTASFRDSMAYSTQMSVLFLSQVMTRRVHGSPALVYCETAVLWRTPCRDDQDLVQEQINNCVRRCGCR